MPNKYPPIVANKFDPTLDKKPVCCPHCDSKRVQYRHSSSTLLGSSGRGANPNHEWNYYFCQECSKEFTFETKLGEAWYVAADGEVLKGLPNCFENYILKCAYCGGKVHRKYRNPDGSPHEGSLCYRSDGTKDHEEWYECEDCHKAEKLDSK